MKKLHIFLTSFVLLLIISNTTALAQTEDTFNLRVMTFNVNHPGFEHLVADYVVQNNIDVFAIQEEGFGHDPDEKDQVVCSDDLLQCSAPSGIINYVKQLHDRLIAGGYPHMYISYADYCCWSGKSVMVTFSKYPIVDQYHDVIGNKRDPNHKKRRPIYTAVIDTPGGEIAITNIHTNAGSDYIDEHMTDVFNYLNSYTDRSGIVQHIAIGDFNWDRFESDDHIASAYGDHWIDTRCISDPFCSCSESRWCLSHEGDSKDEDWIPDKILMHQRSNLTVIGTWREHGFPTPESFHKPIVTDFSMPAINLNCEVTTSYQCIDNGNSIAIEWSVTNADFEPGKIVTRINNLLSEGWTPGTIRNPNASGDIYYETRYHNLTTVILPLRSDAEYAYRVDVYDDADSIEPVGICNSRLSGQDKPLNCGSLTVSPDYDNNGYVDIRDYATLISVFGSEDCEYNLAKGCEIDIFDFVVLIQNFSAT